MFYKTRIKKIKLALILGFAAICLIYGLETHAVDLKPPSWKKLNFVTSILFFTAESVIEFDKVDSTSVKPQLSTSKYGEPLLDGKREVNNILIQTKFLGKTSNISLFFESNLNTLQRTQLDSGKKNRFKAYQFLEKGVYSLRSTPVPGEEQQSYTAWTGRSDEYFQYPTNFNVQKPVIDSSNLFFIMTSGIFKKPGDKVTFTAFVKNRLLDLSMVAQEYVELNVEYIERKNGRKEYLEEEVEVLRISVVPHVYSGPENKGQKQSSEFKFLGLNGNLQFYVDTKKRLLVQLSGNIDIVGNIDIILSEVEF